MSEATRHIRNLMAGDGSLENWQLFELMLGVIDHQQEQINNLRETMNNQYQHQGNQIAGLRKEIERLKGIHGA